MGGVTRYQRVWNTIVVWGVWMVICVTVMVSDCVLVTFLEHSYNIHGTSIEHS